MRYLFWLAIFAICYTYFGYPFLIQVLTYVIKSRPINKAKFTPFISIVIAAYNEEKNIGRKLENLLQSDYPKDKMEICVVSDVSSDKTDEIVRGFADRGVKLLRLGERSGKIAAHRRALTEAKGEIVIFSDATSIMGKDSISNLISNFNDKSVGCAGGLLVYVNSKEAEVGKGEERYWNYEVRIKDYESRLSSLTSVSGTLYAIRRELYPLDMKDYLADDLIAPLTVIKKGLRVVFDTGALCKDFTTLSIKEEIAKRVRITVQNIRGLLDNPDIMNPFKYGLYSILVISHKLLRILAPLFLLVIFASSWVLSYDSGFFSFILMAQVLFYAAGVVGYYLNKKVNFGLANAVFYFCLSNLSIFLGIIESFKGRKVATWETVRT